MGQIGLGTLPEGERRLARTLRLDLDLAQHRGQNDACLAQGCVGCACCGCS